MVRNLGENANAKDLNKTFLDAVDDDDDNKRLKVLFALCAFACVCVRVYFLAVRYLIDVFSAVITLI